MSQRVNINNGMSIFNNYTVADSQGRYYQLVKTLISVLQKRILRFYQGRKCNQQKFFTILHKLIHKIAKAEKNKFQEPLFQDSIDTLFQEISPFSQEQFKGVSAMSEVSLGFDDRITHVSLNSSFDQLPRSKFKVRTQENELFESARRQKYHSMQTAMGPIKTIDEVDELFTRARTQSRNKLPQFKKIKVKLKPPKVAPYIENIKEELLGEESPQKKQMKKFTGEPYLAQRRRKDKKIIRTVIYQH